MRKNIYSSYSSNRLAPFRTATIISSENGGKSVKKSPLGSQSVAHIATMEASYHTLKSLLYDTEIDVVPCRKQDDTIIFDFIKGQTAEKYLLTVLKEQGLPALLTAINKLFSHLSHPNITTSFVKTAEFEQVFGNVPLESDCEAYRFSNVDLNFDNLIFQCADQARLTIIDYEWCFNFPVPTRYVFYRAVWSFQQKSPLQAFELFPDLGFSEDECATFSKMDANFNRYVFGSSTFERSVPGHYFLKNSNTLKEIKQLSELSQARGEELIKQAASFNTQMENALKEIKQLSEVSQAREQALVRQEQEISARGTWIEKLDKDITELNDTIVAQAQTIEAQKSELEQLKQKKGLFGR